LTGGLRLLEISTDDGGYKRQLLPISAYFSISIHSPLSYGYKTIAVYTSKGCYLPNSREENGWKTGGKYRKMYLGVVGLQEIWRARFMFILSDAST
jgi:hypothetical protein